MHKDLNNIKNSITKNTSGNNIYKPFKLVTKSTSHVQFKYIYYTKKIPSLKTSHERHPIK